MRVISCKAKKRRGKHSSEAARRLEIDTTLLAAQTQMPLDEGFPTSAALWVPEDVVPAGLRGGLPQQPPTSQAQGAIASRPQNSSVEEAVEAGPSTNRQGSRGASAAVGFTPREGAVGGSEGRDGMGVLIDLTSDSDSMEMEGHGGDKGMIIDLV